LDAGAIDALHAIGALLHDAAEADGYVRVLLHGQGVVLPLVGVIEEVEPPNLVRAIVGAIPRADAAVVHHVVQAFVGMRRGGHGTNLFARRVFALLAGHDLEDQLGIVHIAREIAIEADPVHFAAAHHLFLADNGHVVLGHAGDKAGIAAGATVEVNHHAPLHALGEIVCAARAALFRRSFGPKRKFFGMGIPGLFGKGI